MSNGSTAVFVQVLMLAVSDLVDQPWDYRFAGFLNLRDQNVVGGGTVGFDLADVNWGTSPQQCVRSKDFVLRVTRLALTRHRWAELGFDPPFTEDKLREFQAMVKAYVPSPRPTAGRRFPGPDEAARASCVRHRVLNGHPYWAGCVFCHGQSGWSHADSAALG
jgi:hypothetical protein